MIKYDSYSEAGRTLYVRFHCRRCGAEQYKKLQECANDDYGYLRNTKMPQGWGSVSGGLMCEKCYAQYLVFINGEDLKGGADNV